MSRHIMISNSSIKGFTTHQSPTYLSPFTKIHQSWNAFLPLDTIWMFAPKSFNLGVESLRKVEANFRYMNSSKDMKWSWFSFLSELCGARTFIFISEESFHPFLRFLWEFRGVCVYGYLNFVCKNIMEEKIWKKNIRFYNICLLFTTKWNIKKKWSGMCGIVLKNTTYYSKIKYVEIFKYLN